MIPATDPRHTYVSEWQQRFQSILNCCEETLRIDQQRKDAIRAFSELGFPTVRDEQWRFTNLAGLTRIPFHTAKRPHDQAIPRTPALLSHGLLECPRLVFLNGYFAPQLSTLGALPNAVLLTNFSADSRYSVDSGIAVPHLGRVANYRHHALTALNTASWEDAAVLWLPEDTAIDQPIHLLYVSVPADTPTVAYPRAMIVAEAGSRATILESYASLNGSTHDRPDSDPRPPEGSVRPDAVPGFTNAVTELVLHSAATLDYCRLQDEADSTFHIGSTHAHLAGDAEFRSCVVSRGCALSRHELNVVLDGERSECSLNGLAIARGRQLIDHQTLIEHLKPNGTSRELYKTIAADKAHAVFNGMIHVDYEAQKTDARQASHTLLLSDDAVVNAQPHLEIYADDVKCMHGATVGSLSDEALFYLRTRGIGQDEARQLLTFAFGNEVVERIPLKDVRKDVERQLLQQTRLAHTATVLEAAEP